MKFLSQKSLMSATVAGNGSGTGGYRDDDDDDDEDYNERRGVPGTGRYGRRRYGRGRRY